MSEEAEAVGAMWMVEVVVMPKDGVNDPEGEAILGGLHSLGHSTVRQVRAGRVLRMMVSAPDQVSARTAAEGMCEQLLANPVIETYQIAVRSLAAVEATA